MALRNRKQLNSLVIKMSLLMIVLFLGSALGFSAYAESPEESKGDSHLVEASPLYPSVPADAVFQTYDRKKTLELIDSLLPLHEDKGKGANPSKSRK